MGSPKKKIEKLLREVKKQYTYPTLPVKWNFKDLKGTYEEWNRIKDYNKLKEKSYEWRTEIFQKSLEIDYKVILACTQRHSSDIPLSKIKEKLTAITFTQVLMRIGLFAAYQPFKSRFEIILDWPDSSNPKPFNREYFRAYNAGKSSSGVGYHSGPLCKLGFNDSLYFAKSTHSAVLQFADLVLGAAKDYILKTIQGTNHSLGYDLTTLILKKYHGYPNKIVDYSMNYAPKDSENYKKIKEEIKKNVA